MRVALNGWSLTSTHTGIASYTRNLAVALQRIGGLELNLFYGFGWSQEIRSTSLPGMDSAKAWVKRLIPRPYAIMRWIQQRRFTSGVRPLYCDVYHEPSFLPFRFDGPTVITVHDLSPLRFPGAHPAVRVERIASLLPDAVQRANAIIVDSEFVRREVLSEFGITPDRVTAIHLGVAGDYRPRGAAEVGLVLQRYGLTHGAYCLAVGTLEPRKNLIQAIDAHAELPETARQKTPLVIAGMRGWLTEGVEARIRQQERRGEVRWLGYVPAAELPLIYAGARFLVYPSLYEGFGLPVLEAMASGIPVITSNRASLPEVAGDVGILVDPEDVDGLREQMQRLIEDRAEAQRLGGLGVARARQFTWQACAEKTLAIYREALAGHGQ